jgi:hypothetical protein
MAIIVTAGQPGLKVLSKAKEPDSQQTTRFEQDFPGFSPMDASSAGQGGEGDKTAGQSLFCHVVGIPVLVMDTPGNKCTANLADGGA